MVVCLSVPACYKEAEFIDRARILSLHRHPRNRKAPACARGRSGLHLLPGPILLPSEGLANKALRSLVRMATRKNIQGHALNQTLSAELFGREGKISSVTIAL